MKRELGRILWTETDDGFVVEAHGEAFKKLAECGCLPLMAGGRGIKVQCCTGDEACCSADRKEGTD